jgi:ADP-dependent NAD(P)H-hydrate dehydratase / NAD(P)H-hydrate epimerase
VTGVTHDQASGPALSRAAVRALDRRAILEVGVPSIVLMENAGRAVADEALRMLAPRPGAAVILAGLGNNGGDGLVVARTLENRGQRARVVFVGSHEQLEQGTPDFRTNLALWRRQGGDLALAPDPDDLAALAGVLRAAPLLVDALFGTGLTRPLAGAHAAAVAALNASGAPVLSIDVPSGLDADTGLELGVAVRAQATVTFVAPKPGFVLNAGPACVGRVVVAEIGIPRFLVEEALRAPG